VQSPSDDEIARVSKARIVYWATKDPQYDWSFDTEEVWREAGDWSAMWRYVLQLCRDVGPDENESIGMIGTSQLENLIEGCSDMALPLIEVEVESNPTLLQALSFVWTREQPVRERIDAILARHGRERS
jgi:hypothetical protein